MLHRIDAVQKRLRKYHLDALLVSSPAHIYYLFGFTGSNAIGIVHTGEPVVITDRRYTDQARQEVEYAAVHIAQRDLFSELANLNIDLSKKKLGLEVQHLCARDYFQLRKLLPETHFMATEHIIERICSVKEDFEIESIRAAAAICAKVFEEITSLIKTGVTEQRLSAEISYRTKCYGSESDPFAPIVASGERSALPHGTASDKTIATNELIIVDFGATINGYAADCTRTFYAGELNDEQKKLIDVVSEALNQAEKAAKPGLPCKELDAAARTYIAGENFGKYFSHSLGHGLGLNVHELPRIGENSNDILQSGQVITLEPGIYVPGTGGVRIEDNYRVTGDSVENISAFPREVLCVC